MSNRYDRPARCDQVSGTVKKRRDVTLEIEGFLGYLEIGSVETTTEGLGEALKEMLEAPKAKELIAKFPDSAFKIRVRKLVSLPLYGVPGVARSTRRVRR